MKPQVIHSPYEKMPYDPVEDFAPVSTVIAFPGADEENAKRLIFNTWLDERLL